MIICLPFLPDLAFTTGKRVRGFGNQVYLVARGRSERGWVYGECERKRCAIPGEAVRTKVGNKRA